METAELLSQIEQIKSILKTECGATDSGLQYLENYFAETMHDQRGGEWRFQGNMGFGGKLYITFNRPESRLHLYMSFYSEDKTPTREEAKRRADAQLDDLIFPIEG